MPIDFACPSCGCKMRTADHHAGTPARCPKCNCSLTVPSPDHARPALSASPPLAISAPEQASNRAADDLLAYPTAEPGQAEGRAEAWQAHRTPEVITVRFSDDISWFGIGAAFGLGFFLVGLLAGVVLLVLGCLGNAHFR